MRASTRDTARVNNPILLFGRNGQLARAMRRSALARGAVVECVGSDTCDLVEDVACATRHVHSGLRAVVNASAWTDVDGAEGASHANTALNAVAPGAMAAACAHAGVPFVHVSTDYVFSGEGNTAWLPTSPVAPLNAYGRAKAKGERAVMAAGGNALVLRTSWVFDGTGRNFATTMLRLAQSRDEVRVVDDQRGRPTYAGALAEAVFAALDVGWNGSQLHHIQGAGAVVSWAGFARAVFRAAGLPTRVVPIASSDYPTPAPRPRWSVMDTTSFETAFAHPMLPWREGLALALQERHR